MTTITIVNESSTAPDLIDRAILLHFETSYPHLTVLRDNDTQRWTVFNGNTPVQFKKRFELTRCEVQDLSMLLDKQQENPALTLFEFECVEGSIYAGVGVDVSTAFRQAGLTRGHFMSLDSYAKNESFRATASH